MQPGKPPTSSPAVYDELAAIQQELDKCMHCGGCMAVCPVYATDKIEAGVARGKIGVAEAVMQGNLALDDPAIALPGGGNVP